MTAADFTALRLALGLTQSDMGARVGLSQAQVSRIESGERSITPMLEMLLCARKNGKSLTQAKALAAANGWPWPEDEA